MNITVDRVSFTYNGETPVLNEIELEARSGELHALIGPNGSGKSTLLKVISGVLRPSAGTVCLGDTPVKTLSTRRIAQRLAMVEQDREMGFDFSVREVVAMGRTPHRGRFARESGRDRRAVERAMQLADIRGLADRSIRAVSGGERQRVFLAMALAQEPEALLLDEPTTHLDLRHQVRFMSIVQEWVREGRTVLIAIHDLTLAAQTTDRTVLLSDGRIVATGRPSEVLIPTHLKQVFDVDVVVGTHPEPRVHYVLPRLPGRGRSTSQD
jgi:iron complex transport system ATP-binding protein